MGGQRIMGAVINTWGGGGGGGGGLTLLHANYTYILFIYYSKI